MNHSDGIAGAIGSGPGSVELLGLELLEEHARRLGALFTVSRRPRGHGRPHLQRLDENRRALKDAYNLLAGDVRRGEIASPAMEWLLDNFHIIAAAGRDVFRDLPSAYFRRLPTIAADEFEGMPRIYALALELIRTSSGQLDAQRLSRFIVAFQSVTPLTIGELWAWPSALKLALIEHLRSRADVMVATRAQRQDADRVAGVLEQIVVGCRQRTGRIRSTRRSRPASCSAFGSTAKSRRRSARS